jgi:peptidoglycan/LPS O-acetylase OafA/YrhL
MLVFLFLSLCLSEVRSSECSESLSKVLSHVASSLFSNTSYPSDLSLIRNSGRFVNELGHYEACVRRHDAKYFLLKAQAGLKLVTGVCLPKACSADEVSLLVSEKSSGKVTASAVYSKSVTGFGWFIITCLIFFTLLGIWGSFQDFSKRKSLPLQAIHAFSFKSNYSSLMLVRENKPGDYSSILDSIRVFSIIFVIFTHSFSFKTQNPIYNFEEYENFFTRGWRVFPYIGEMAVDAFFWIGGFLLGYLLLQEVEKKRGKFGVLGWSLVYVHRIARVLPVYAFMLAFYMNIFPALGEGPVWYTTKIVTLDCSEYWWSVVLFLNNFIPGGSGNQCLGVGWYLANDMQFFVFGPALILMYYFLARWVSWVFKFLLILVGFIVSFVIAYDNEYRVFRPSRKNYVGGDEDYYHVYYTKPYTRFFPYLIGLYCGYIYLRYYKSYVLKQEDTHKDRIAEKVISIIQHKTYGAVLFIAAWVLTIYTVTMVNELYDHAMDDDYWSDTKNAIWLPLRHILFSYGLSFVLLPIMMGRFFVFQKFLTAKAFGPLGKLSFTCFLVQFGMLFFVFGSDTNAAVINGVNLFKDSVLGVVLSFAASFPVYMLIEAPFANLEKIICSLIARSKSG